MSKFAPKWHISTITQDNFDKQELIRHLFIGQIKKAFLFASDFDSSEILNSICNYIEKNIGNKHLDHFYFYSILWLSKILLASVHHIQIKMIQDFYFSEIAQMINDKKMQNNLSPKEKDLYNNLLREFCSVQKIFENTKSTISINDALIAIEHLSNINIIDKNIILALQPSITLYMKQISIKKNQHINFTDQINSITVLSIYKDISENEFSAYVNDLSIFSDENNLKELMCLFFLFYRENFSKKIQTVLTSFDLGSYLQSLSNKYLILYPLYAPEGFFSLYILSNSSLSSSEHFVDILWKKKMKQLITHFDEAGEKNPFVSLPDLEILYPFFFVACFDILYPHKNIFYAVIQSIFQKNSDKYSQISPFIKSKISCIENLIQSVENDNELVYKISQDLGKKITLDNLASQSIPFIFKDKILKCSDLHFIDIKSFLISEQAMEIDQSFLSAPKIYITVINYVIGQTKEIDIPKSYFEYFKDDEIRRKIFIDIYSLIFLQDKDNSFFCSLEKADLILQFLTSFNATRGMTSDEQNLIRTSHQHITFTQINQDSEIFKKENNLRSAIFSYENYLRGLIISGKKEDFQTAKALVPSLGSMKLKAILQILLFMQNPDNQKLIDDQYKYCFAVELNFSGARIDNNDSNNNYEEEEKELTDKEVLFMSWLNDSHLIDSQKYFSKYTLSLINDLNILHSRFIKPLDILLKKGNLIHISTWRAYMALYAKFEEAVKNDKNNQHYDPSKRLDPAEIVQILHKSEINASMSNLDTLLGPHALEFLLLYTPDFNEKIYKLVESKSPITAQAIRYELAIKGIYKSSDVDNAYEHLLEKKAGYGDDEFEIISTDFEALADSHDSSLISFTTGEINELIDKYANINPLPIKILNAIFLREPAIYIQKMKNIVRNDLKRFTVNQLLELYPFSGMKSLPLLKRMNVSIIDEHDIIYLLIKKTRWTTLHLFLDDLRYLFDLSKKEEGDEIEERFLQYLTSYIKENPSIIPIVPKEFLAKIDIEQFIISNTPQDYDTFYVIESISDLNYYLRSDEEFDVTETIDMINRLLQPLVIDNNFRELIQRQIRKLSLLFSKRFKHSFATKLKALSSMLYKDLLGRYGIVISLSNFSKETFGSHVAKIYLKYDFFKECQEICAAWSLDLSMYKAEMALSAFKIGLINEGMDFISPSIRNDQLVDQIVDILSNKFMFDYSPISSITELDCVEKYVYSIDPCYHWINAPKTDANGLPEIDEPLVAESPQIKVLHKLLIDLNSIDKLIMFYASKGYFEYAFDTWNKIQRKHTKSELFIRSIVFPSLIFQNWTSLWMKVRKMQDLDQTNNNSNNQMKQYVMDLFKFLHQRKMGHTAYNIQMALHLYSLAFKTANDYFSEMTSWEGQMRIIDAMRKASKRDKEISKYLLSKIDFEEQYIIKPCIENNTPFIPGLDIMTTKENSLKAGVFLMKKGEADTVILKLLPMTLFTLDELCHAMLDDVMLSGVMGVAMHKLFLAIEKANLQNYEVIILNLFKVINTRVSDRHSLSQFIDENVRDCLKGRVFLTFGFLDRAYECAVKTNDVDLIDMLKDDVEKGATKKDDDHPNE